MHAAVRIAALPIVFAIAALAHPALEFALRDTEGVEHHQNEWAQARAVVLFFVTTDCPLSNGYAPEMNRIEQAYAPRGVLFFAVQGDTTIPDEEVRRHAREYGYRFPALLDPRQVLARHTGATVTPEAVVLSADGAVLYLGRIDNKVEDFGKTRLQATEFDLRDALDAILAGRTVPHPRTRALGCAITKANTAMPTFNKDIAPILYQNCTTCHRPGEVAPFSLLTYTAADSPDGGYACCGGPKFPPVGLLGGWAPGASPPPDSPSLSQLIRQGTDIVVQIHYHPSGKPEEDQSALGLKFSSPPTKGRAGIILSNRRIAIPAGDPHYVVKTGVTVPRDVDVFGITPHAHYLGKDMQVNAVLPDGSIQHLIRIKDWDFNWQGQYRYKEPVHLPQGTRIELEYVYDNSENNPHNPSHPPVPVTWGEETKNEMAVLFLGVVLPSPADVPAFRREMRTQYMESFLAEGNGIDDLPPGIPKAELEFFKRVFQTFDKNGDGKLDAEERAALMQYLHGLRQ
jgi:thiol-disulfide isomerase/thioredoxin